MELEEIDAVGLQTLEGRFQAGHNPSRRSALSRRTGIAELGGENDLVATASRPHPVANDSLTCPIVAVYISRIDTIDPKIERCIE